MAQDDKALQDLFDTVHYSVELVDTSPDEDEYVKYMAEYMKRYRESNNK